MNRLALVTFALTFFAPSLNAELFIAWQDDYLTITGDDLPGGEISVLYLEAYCRANSHEADWGKHTVVGHTTRLIDATEDGRKLQLRCEVVLPTTRLKLAEKRNHLRHPALFQKVQL